MCIPRSLTRARSLGKKKRKSGGGSQQTVREREEDKQNCANSVQNGLESLMTDESTKNNLPRITVGLT